MSCSKDKFWCISATWEDEKGAWCEPITNVTTHGDVTVEAVLNGPMSAAYRQILLDDYGSEILAVATFHADEISREEFEPS